MLFNLNYPWVLLLIPAAAAYIIFTSGILRRKDSSEKPVREKAGEAFSKASIKELPGRGRRGSLAGLSRGKRTAIIVLRIMVLALLILCVAGFGLRKVSDTTTSIFVVDSSDSMSRAKAAVEAFIGQAVKNKKQSDKVGIVNFGSGASVELSPSVRPDFTSIQTRVNGSFTNMEQGLKLAASLIPAGDRKRVVLVSDGAENAGDALKQARLLKQQDIIVDVFQTGRQDGPEVQVKELSVPESLRLNEKFEIVVNVDSTVKTKAALKLYTGKELTAEKSVELQTGENRFAFSDIIGRKGGMVTYSAVIEADEDTLSKNNSMSAFSYVEDMAKILVVQDSNAGAGELVKMLGSDVNVQVSKPENVPVSVEELQKYDAFIISDVSAERLDNRFLDSLEVCIKHQGKGLLVTGGEDSYAPGGYFKTTLEKVLPVNMDIKPKEELPNLGLVLVIDKSGSMSEGQYGISKIELAKEAAIRSTEVLRKEDMVGVIGFDSSVQWVVKTQKLDDLKTVQDAIGTIRADGGTQILPPLEEAYKSLKDADTKLKHIILLTDGQAEKAGYEPIIDEISKAGITLSTVAVGSAADTELLQALAAGGNGRFYMTDEFTDIPKIFAKETFLAGKSYINNRIFTPVLKGYSEILKGISSIPSLDGYVGTTAKDAAKVVFASDRDEPVLATWQYGLGRTAAWTSDASGMWTSRWLQWDQAAQFWKNIVSWILQKRESEDYTIKAGMSSGTGSVELILPPDGRSSDEQVEAVMVSPSGTEENIVLDPVSPGVYRGSFNSEETGVYIANISVKSGDGTIKNISAGVAIPYSPEYDIDRKDRSAFLERLADEGGGRVLKSSAEVFDSSLAPVVSVTDMTPILLVAAMLLLMADIALRRLNIPKYRLEAAAGAIARKASAVMDIAVKPARDAFKRFRKIPANTWNTPEESFRAAEKSDSPPPAALSSRKEETAAAPGKNGKDHISVLLEKKRKREG